MEPIGVDEHIATDEYRGCIPRILKSIDSKNHLFTCLEIILEELGSDYDPTDKDHIDDLNGICGKITMTYLAFSTGK